MVSTNNLIRSMLTRFWPAFAESRLFCNKSVRQHERPAAKKSVEGLYTKENPESTDVFVYMPGLKEEHVKVSADNNTIFIKAKGNVTINGKLMPKSYYCEFYFPHNRFKISDFKAEMKMDLNGLKVSVPKLKDSEG